MTKFRPYSSPLIKLLIKLRQLNKFSLSKSYFIDHTFDPLDLSLATAPNTDLEFLGAFNPYWSMAKDIVDTFKPYKSGFYVWRDLLQPLRGIGNVAKGLIYILIIPFLLLCDFTQSIYSGIKNRSLSVFIDSAASSLVGFITGLFDGINNIVRGSLQFATTPLTWFLRMPLRALITAVKGWPTFEETQAENARTLARLVKKEGKTLEDAREIDNKLVRFACKIYKAEKQGQEFVDKEVLRSGLSQPMAFKRKEYLASGEFSPYIDDCKENREAALQFLSLFARKENKSPKEISKSQSLQA